MLDADELESLIDKGHARAVAYGFMSERGVCKFLNLMFTFGRDFDRDPGLGWVRPFLDAAQARGPTLQMGRLCRRAHQHADRAQGLDGGLAGAPG